MKLPQAELPLVSVVIPFYKQEAYLPETVASVLEEGYPNRELIIVDDGSPVAAKSCLPQEVWPNVLRTENNGLSAARNRGFAASSGEFLLFLDSDDRLVPGSIRSQIKRLVAHPNAALSFGSVSTIDMGGTQIAAPHICRPRNDYFHKLLEGNVIATPGSVMFRRGPLVEAGVFDESFRMAEDYRLYLKLARYHQFVLNEDWVLERRMHGNNMSKSLEPMLAATIRALDLLEVEVQLSPRERRQLNHGRRRWTHEYRRRDDFAYRSKSLWYDLRSMLSVSPRHIFFRARAS